MRDSYFASVRNRSRAYRASVESPGGRSFEILPACETVASTNNPLALLSP